MSQLSHYDLLISLDSLHKSSNKFYMPQGLMYEEETSSPVQDKSVRNAMDKNYIASLVKSGVRLVTSLAETDQREKELAAQMAQLKFEQQKLQEVRQRQIVLDELVSDLQINITQLTDKSDDLIRQIVLAEEQQQIEINHIKARYAPLIQRHKDNISTNSKEIESLKKEIESLTPKSNVGIPLRKVGQTLLKFTPPNRSLEHEITVYDGGTDGAQLLLAWTNQKSAQIEFSTISTRGPPHLPVHEYLLIVSFPMRGLAVSLQADSSLYGQTVNKKKAKNDMCATILPLLKGWYDDRDMTGDIRLTAKQWVIEKNPGPQVYSRFMDYTLEDREHATWRRQPKYERKAQRKTRNRLRKCYSRQNVPIEPIIEELPSADPDPVFKNTHRTPQKQIDDKNRRLARDYRAKHKKLRNSPYSGDLEKDLVQFWDYLLDHGYASNMVYKVTPIFIQRVFEKWCRSGKLVHARQVIKLYNKHPAFYVPDKFAPQYRSRKLLLEAFICCRQMPAFNKIETLIDKEGKERTERFKDLYYLQDFLHGAHRMDPNIGITLNDIRRAHIKIKNRNMSHANLQMKASSAEVPLPTPESYVGGTLRAVGRKIGEGMTEVVMPLISKVTDAIKGALPNFPSLETCFSVIRLAGILLMCAVVGWAVVFVTRKISMGLDVIFADPSLEATYVVEMRSATPQMFGTALAKTVATGWLETLDSRFKAFSQFFSDSEMLKFTKKLGDFSAAVKNIEWLLLKIKEMFVWAVNATCKIFSGKPFFQDARNVQALHGKIVELMTTLSIEDISDLSDPMKEAFEKAYMDLTEMFPYVFSVDRTMGAIIQSTLAKANPLFRQCTFYLRTNLIRSETYYVALEGLAGQGKTILGDHLQKMIYDGIRIKSPEIFKKIFHPNSTAAEILKYTDSLVYTRMPEQEFWDNYCNQPFTRLDDLGQSTAPETRAAEFFSVIRMINSIPYPLHMADITRKETTVFKSHILITSTNMNEALFKKKDELGLIEPKAYLRRRDVSIHVSRIPGYVQAGSDSIEYLDGFRLKVYYPDKMTGELGKEFTVSSYKELMNLVHDICNSIIARHAAFTNKTFMDHTGFFAGMEAPHETIVEAISTAAPQPVQNTQLTLNESLRKIHKENIDGSEIDVSGIFEMFDQIDKAVARDMTVIDMKFADQQMFFNIFPSKPEKYRNVFNSVHPEAALVIEKLSGVRPEKYEEAVLAVQKIREEQQLCMDPDWDHKCIVNGPSEDAMTLGEQMFLKMLHSATEGQIPHILRSDREKIAELYSVNQSDVREYIGLSNPIYWIDGKRRTALMATLREMGYNRIWTYDQYLIKSLVDRTDEQDLATPDKENRELFLWEYKHERMLRLNKGQRPLLERFLSHWQSILLAMVPIGMLVAAAVMIYRYLDPSRDIDMNFAIPQSGDPQLTRAQRDLARAKGLPKVPGNKNMSSAVQHFEDAVAAAQHVKVWENVYTLRGTKGTREFGCYCVGIEDSICLMPAHFIAAHPEMIYISGLDDTIERSFTFESVKYQYVRPINGYSSADLALVYLPMTKYFKKISHLLFQEKDNFEEAAGLCLQLREATDEKLILRTYEATRTPTIEVGKNYGGKYEVNQIMMAPFSVVTTHGDCTMPYVYYNPSIERKIGWFHIAYMDGHCMAGRLNQEDVEKFRLFLKKDLTGAHHQVYSKTIVMEPQILPQHHHLCFEESQEEKYGLKTFGKLNKPFLGADRSRLVATPMCKPTILRKSGDLTPKEPPFPVNGGPAQLRAVGDKDPMNIGLESVRDRKLIYGQYLQSEDYDGTFNEALNDSTGRILSLYEVIHGLRNHPKRHSIKRSASAGFYHKLFNKLKREYVDMNADEYEQRKHKDLMVLVGENTWLHKEILDLVIWIFKFYKESKIPLNWVIAMLKDEVRPKERVEQFKTRIFYAGNFAFMIVCRMVFGEFTTHLEANWRQTDIAVGCNPYSADWTWIHRKIRKFGNGVKDDDIRKYDQNFPVTEFVHSFTPRYVEFYQLKGRIAKIDLIIIIIEIPHEDLIYCVILQNFHCATVIGLWVFFFILQASGVDLTTLLNSICNSACNRCIIRIEIGRPFKEVAAMWVYGDDLLLNCPLLARARLWELALYLFNHVRTDPKKGTTAVDTDLDNDALFLQRGFKFDGVLMCPLSIDSINGMLQWVEKPKDKNFPKQFSINCKVALMEISRHGEEKFELYKNEINLYLNEYGPTWVINLTYDQARTDIIARVCQTFMTQY